MKHASTKFPDAENSPSGSNRLKEMFNWCLSLGRLIRRNGKAKPIAIT
jgi:hypothetical protein